MHFNANIGQNFAANRGSKSAHKAELWQIWQGHLNREFSEILQIGDQGQLLKNVGYKNNLAEMASCSKKYALKVQILDKILLQTAAPKVPLKPSYSKFGKDT